MQISRYSVRHRGIQLASYSMPEDERYTTDTAVLGITTSSLSTTTVSTAG